MKIIKVFTILLIVLFLTSCNENTIESELSVFKKEQLTLKSNKKIVASFYQDFFGNTNFNAANKYIADIYIQHNPAIADGREALINAGKIWLKDAPKKTINIHNIIAEKDLVFVHIVNIDKQGTRHSTMDVFRVTNGKISEHWDAFASFKKEDKSKNDNPLF